MFLNKKQNILINLTLFTLLITLCEAADKKQDPKCLLPMEPGPCRMSLNRFYYNAQTDTCEEFKFGGCKGNDNKFGFKETCEAACKKSKTTTATTKSPSISGITESSQLVNKQLKSDTMKTLATSATETTSTTTRRPGMAARTTPKTRASTQRSTSTTSTTQKSKGF